ncbi:MAG: hypothetical protein GY927_04145, partial [bacterium]|nr:hypothetical protein [bacterium]
ARGALELTGKHLQELSDFSAEAEMAMGSMGEAAAEMGQSAELTAKTAAASWEIMKITVGEAIRPMTDAIYDGVTAFSEHITEDLAAKDASDAFVESVQGLNLGLIDGQRYMSAATGGTSLLRGTWDETEVVARRLAIATEILNDGFRGSKDELRTLIDEQVRYDEGAAKHEAMQQDLADAYTRRIPEIDGVKAALEEAAWAEEEMAISSRQTAEIIVEDKADESEAIFQTWTMAVAAKDAMVKDSEEIQEVSAARSAAIVAAQEAETAAIMAGREAYNGYALSALESGEATANWTDELFKSAAQGPINQEQLLLLAVATGEYSDAQIQAMLTEAAMRAAVEDLSAALATGDITTKMAIESLKGLEEQLQEDFKAQLDIDEVIEATGVLESGTAAADSLHGSLIALEGEYSAQFTTTYTTIHETLVKDTNSKEPVRALHSGDRFKAGEFLLVGDGPGGQILPTTELVVFDKPGEVFSGAETNRLFGGDSPGGSPFVGGSGDETSSTNIYLSMPLQIIGTPDRGAVNQM